MHENVPTPPSEQLPPPQPGFIEDVSWAVVPGEQPVGAAPTPSTQPPARISYGPGEGTRAARPTKTGPRIHDTYGQPFTSRDEAQAFVNHMSGNGQGGQPTRLSELSAGGFTNEEALARHQAKQARLEMAQAYLRDNP